MGLMFNDKKASDFFLRVFREAVENREKSNLHRNDFVQILMQLKKDCVLNFNECAAESFIFFFGGFHTSSSMLNFIIYELALNQDIQAKLRKEIIEKLDENNGKLRYDSLSEMKYLQMVSNEGLRKHPTIYVMTRKCTKEYKIPESNLIVPKDIHVIIPTYSLHRDPKHFPNPEVFDPERFYDKNINKIKPFTFLPFGGGPRICIGQRFAVMVIKVALVKLLAEFEFSRSHRTLDSMKYSVKSFGLAIDKEELFIKVEKIHL